MTEYAERTPKESDLRDRIAAVICDMDALHARQWSLDVADAVIAALGLREEREDVASFHPGEIDDSMMPPRLKGRLAWTPSHRYVTEWTTDD